MEKSAQDLENCNLCASWFYQITCYWCNQYTYVFVSKV